MKKLVKCRRELVRIVDRVGKLREEYPDEIGLICACEYPPTLKTFLSMAEELSEEERMAAFRKPWYLIDKDGWPIETTRGRRLRSIIRILVQNLRKIMG